MISDDQQCKYFSPIMKRYPPSLSSAIGTNTRLALTELEEPNIFLIDFSFGVVTILLQLEFLISTKLRLVVKAEAYDRKRLALRIEETIESVKKERIGGDNITTIYIGHKDLLDTVS